LQASLSDMNGFDPHLLGGTQVGVLRSVLDCFGKPGGGPPIGALKSLTRKLSRAVAALQREQGVSDPYHPEIFRQAVRAAAQLARIDGLID
jgi:hypothetical protein